MSAAVPAICSTPASRMVRQICRTAVSEKSRPTVKSSRTIPKLRQHLDVAAVADEPGAEWPGDHPGEHQRDDGRHAKARQADDERQRDRVGQEELGEEAVVHVSRQSLVVSRAVMSTVDRRLRLQCARDSSTALMKSNSVASVNAR